MTLPVVNTDNGQVSVDVNTMIEGTGFDIHKLLDNGAFKDCLPKNQRLRVKTDRTTLPERKRGQIVQRAVVMLGRI